MAMGPGLESFSNLSIQPERHKIILGIDYGTTFTGISLVSSVKKSLEDINVIRSWPGPARPVEGNWKTPSRIAYVKQNSRRLSEDKWGFEVEPGLESHCWTKLLLDSSAKRTMHDNSSLAHINEYGCMTLPTGKTAQEVCRDYLALVYQYVFQFLEQRYTPETMNLTSLECWVTVPAIWSDAAKYATRNAALGAGFGSRPGDDLYMITEPEAAAFASLREQSSTGSLNPVKLGERILICDCGGGTVDITTYTVVNLEPLEFDELLVGVGRGEVWSTFIDQNLYKLMSERFGKVFDNLPKKRIAPGSQFMRSFETQKQGFGYRNDDRYMIGPLSMDIEDSEWYDTDDEMVTLSAQDMKNLFEPVINDILSLLYMQLEAIKEMSLQLDRIILVGGFGESPYLNQKLSAWCKANGNIRLLCPENCQSAIARGAALRGLEGGPGSKQCRRHYGIQVDKKFLPGIHDERYSYIDRLSGIKFCRSMMDWMILKGETITRQTNRSIDLRFTADDASKCIYSVDLFASDDNSPPVRYDSRVVNKIASIEIDFSLENLSRFRQVSNTGRPYYSLPFKLKIEYGAKTGILQFSSWILGKPSGAASVKYS